MDELRLSVNWGWGAQYLCGDGGRDDRERVERNWKRSGCCKEIGGINWQELKLSQSISGDWHSGLDDLADLVRIVNRCWGVLSENGGILSVTLRLVGLPFSCGPGRSLEWSQFERLIDGEEWS